MSEQPTDRSRPVLRVVRGEPTAEELAVLTALVAAGGGGPAPQPAPRDRRGHWSDPRLTARRMLYPGTGAWRAATWG